MEQRQREHVRTDNIFDLFVDMEMRDGVIRDFIRVVKAMSFMAAIAF